MKKIFTILLLFIGFANSYATHLVGGSLSYERLGVNSQGQVEYRVRLALYRDCTSDIKFDERIKLGIHENRSGNRRYQTIRIRLDSERKVDPLDNANCGFKPDVCLMEGIYEEVIALPQSSFGYHLSYVRCCRNNLNNVPDGPNGEPDQGQTYYAFIPPTQVVNSSPRFSGVPVPFICVNDTVSLLNSAVDPDGDSLVYRFTTPFQGGSLSGGNSTAEPDPPAFLDLPIQEVGYNAGYNVNFPFGASGYIYINKDNGLTELMSPQVGFYAIAVEVLEFRKGVSQPLSSTRLELQIIVISCPPNKRPQFGGNTANGTFEYEVEEGQQICIDIAGTDADGDNVELLRIGDIFSGPNAATLATAKGNTTVTSRFCWTPACGKGQDEPYTFLVGLHDDGCPKKINNQTYSIKVNKFEGATQIQGDFSPCEFSKAVTYSMNGKASSSYDWEVIGGTIVNGQGTDEITVEWGDDPNAQVRVTEVSLYGCRGATVTVNIDLKEAPNKPNLLGKDIVCQDATETYNITPQQGVSYRWSVINGTFVGGTSGTSVQVRWGTKGTGKIVVIGTNADGCDSDSGIIEVEIRHPEPIIDGSFSVCPNSRFVDYSAEFNNGSTYSWTVVGGSQSAGGQSNAIKVDWGNATTGYVEVVETDRFGCVSDPYRQEIKVDYNLELVFREDPIDSVCEFTTHNYEVQFTNGSTYHWTVDGGDKASKDSLHQLDIRWLTAGEGKFSVYESAYDPIAMRECRSQLIEQTVIINPNPTADIIEGEVELCQTEDINRYTLNGFANSTYQWLVDGQDMFITDGQGSNTVSIRWNQPGLFKLSVLETTEHGCTDEIIDTMILIHPKPTTTPIDGVDVVCFPNISSFKYSVTGFANSTYNWSINGGDFVSENGISEIQVDWKDNWSENQNNFIHLVEVSEYGCVGDTQKLPVWYDKPYLDMSYVSVGTPDDRMEIQWKLMDAPRYDKELEIHKTVFNQSSWKQVDVVSGADDNYLEQPLNTDKDRYTYYVKGYNLCGDSIRSEQHTNILLEGDKPGPYEVEMNFTPYFGWDNGVLKYELYTKKTNLTEYEIYKPVSTDENIYIADLDHFEQCFRVKATEEAGGEEESWSNEICFTFEPILYVPTAFTPNADGLNEKFDVVHRAIKDYNITIFNRWGEKIFYSEDIYDSWDGTYKGANSPQGVYMFIIYYNGHDNHLKVVTGSVTLLR